MTDATTTAPSCAQHGPMALRPAHTPEQEVTGTWWACTAPTCFNAYLQPSKELLAQLEEQGTRRGTITITHTRADGTLLEGSSKGDGVLELVRPHRFTWGRSLPGVLFVRQSRDKRADRISINRAAEALRKAGWTVEITIDEGTRRSFAEAEADRVARAGERTERFTEYAGNAAARSQAHRGTADSISKRFEFGQPILLGHHSQRKAERDAERIDRNMRKSFAEQDKAKHYAARAEASGSYEEFRKNAPRTLRRLEKLRAELRGVERWQRGESNNGYTRALTPATVEELGIRHEELTEEIGYWEHVIKEAEAQGFKVWGPDDFVKGDFARIGGRWYEVLRVNKKTLTVPGGPDIQPVISQETHAYPGMRSTAPYDGVTARKSAQEMAELLAAARAKAAEKAAAAAG